MSSHRPRLVQRLMTFMVDRRLLSDARLLELYPPFWLMRIKVLELAPGWRRLRIRLPLTSVSRNPAGVMFGGYQAALADPVAALACARLFPGYDIWTRAMEIRFETVGESDLELRFDFPEDLLHSVRGELESTGRSTPTFEYGFYLADGVRCTAVRNTVAIRPRGYSRATMRPVPTPVGD